jgi:hypothetical protein
MIPCEKVKSLAGVRKFVLWTIGCVAGITTTCVALTIWRPDLKPKVI